MRNAYKYLIGVIVFGLVFLLLFTNIPQEVMGGFETLSLSSVDIEDQGERLILTGTVGKGADYIDIDWSANEINNRLDNWEVERDVRGKIELKDLQHIYPTTQERDKTYYASGHNSFLRLGQPSNGQSEIVERCKNHGYQDTTFGYLESRGWFKQNRWHCIIMKPYGRNAIPSGEGYTDFKVDFEIGGDSDTMTRDNQIVSLQNGKVKAKYEGSLTALDTLDELNYNTFYRHSKIQHLISKSAVDYTGKNDLKNYVLSCVGDADYLETGKFESCIADYGDMETDILESKNKEFVDSNRIVRGVNLYSDNINVDLEPQTQEYPMVKLVIDADWIGIDPQEGEPKITSCVNDIDMDSGDEVIESYIVKNIGGEDSSIIAGGSCDSDSVELFSSGGYIKPGASKEFDARITATAEEKDISTTCKLLVQDENSGDTDSCNFDVNVNYIEQICEPGNIRCNTETGNLEKCDADGNGYSLYEECDEACGWNADEYEYTCGEEEIVPDTDCAWYQTEKDGECALKNWIGWTVVILPIVLIIIIVVMVKSNKKTKRKHRRRRY